ncbi:hypothetical protein BDN72DRAFT_542052 [Pluteus cervinus]|uniref:Uncharacterized protein n=1 Tax=Pluteus cervinus TaxID=181527 RepID=A0ACD3AYJ3_9AGAR|nr:hypothetical protein BDN72DRAFT_542052 [Pluteus cervinus]
MSAMLDSSLPSNNNYSPLASPTPLFSFVETVLWAVIASPGNDDSAGMADNSDNSNQGDCIDPPRLTQPSLRPTATTTMKRYRGVVSSFFRCHSLFCHFPLVCLASTQPPRTTADDNQTIALSYKNNYGRPTTLQ